MKLFLLYTCDSWKSRNSFALYYIGASSKAGIKRIAKIIAKGIKGGTFAYNSDGERNTDEQIAFLEYDMLHGTLSVSEINNRLEYGYLTLVPCDSFL